AGRRRGRARRPRTSACAASPTPPCSEPPTRSPSPPACARPWSACGRAARRRGRRRPARPVARGASPAAEPTAEHGEVNPDAGRLGLEARLAEPRELILDAVGLVHLPVDVDRPLLPRRRDDDVPEDDLAAR